MMDCFTTALRAETEFPVRRISERQEEDHMMQSNQMIQ